MMKTKNWHDYLKEASSNSEPNWLDYLNQASESNQNASMNINFSPGHLNRKYDLLRNLGGKMPVQGKIPKIYEPTFGPGGFGGAGADVGRLIDDPQEIKRRDAYNELQNMGYSPEEIAGALAYEKAITPPSQAPRIAGATALSILAGQLIPGPTDEAIALGQISKSARAARAGLRAIMTGAGGAGGKALQQWADPDAEFNSKELAKVFGEDAALEYITLGLAPIGKKIIGGAKKTAIQDAKRLSDKLATWGKKAGVKSPTRFLPAQFSENQLIDTIQGIGENSLIGSNAIYQYKKGQLKAAAFGLSEVVDDVYKGARNFDDMAALVIDTIEDRKITHKIVANRLYGALDVAIGSNEVDLRTAKNLAGEMLNKAKKAGNIGQTDKSLSLLRKIANLDDVASFETAQDIRSGLLDIKRAGLSKLTPDPKSSRIASLLIGSIDNSMVDAAKKAGPKVEALYRRANWFYKSGEKRFSNKLIRKLIRNVPDNPEAAKVIFKNKTNIVRAKKAVGNKVFQETKASWLKQIIEESSVPDYTVSKATGEPLGMKILKRFKDIGPEGIDAAFTKSEQQSIIDSGRILSIIQSSQKGQSGALRFVQGAALAGVVTGPLVEKPVGKELSKGGGILLFGPAVLGRLMTKPWFAKLLSEGYKANPLSQTGIALTARITRAVLQTRKEINEERKRREKLRIMENSEPIQYPARQLGGFGGRGY